jgi:hypothetical protein
MINLIVINLDFDMFQNWYNFNEDKSINAFAYFTEIFKRGLAKGWNDLYKKKGDNEHQKNLFLLIAQMMEMDYTLYNESANNRVGII